MALNDRINVELVVPSRPVLVPLFLLRNFKRVINIYKNTLPILAAVTPPDVRLTVTDESVERVSIKNDIDILGINLITPFALRGYQIAKMYREAYGKQRKRITIVFGGSHATALPEEALQHGDAVVLGEAEKTWPQLLKDFAEGRIKDIYPSHGIAEHVDMEEIPLPNRRVTDGLSLIKINAIQLSRGCPRACEFCSIGTGQRVRRFSMERVEEELRMSPGRYVVLLDDNFFGNVEKDESYISSVLALFRKYRKTWFCQMPLYAVNNRELIDEVIGSGCLGVYIGIDSVPETINGRLLKNRVEEPAKSLKDLRRKGLYVTAGFVFGFDSESTSVFDETLNFARQASLNLASFHILTPYPGTRLYERLERENRLLFDKQWDLYDTAHVVFRPKNMSPDDLYKGFHYAINKFYSFRSIIERNVGFDPIHIMANSLYFFGARKRCHPPLMPSSP